MPLMPSDFAALLLGLGFCGLLLIPAILLMHILMPKAVLARYWKQPYFRPAELALFTGTFFAPMHTVMFMWTFLFSRAGRKRKIDGIRDLAPLWYRLASIVLGVWILITAFGLVSLAVGLHVYWTITGQ